MFSKLFFLFKPEQTKKDLLIIVDFEPPLFFITYKYFLTFVSNLPPHWGSNPPVYEANALPFTPQQTAILRILYVTIKDQKAAPNRGL